jgi:serine/threonine protein kinase
MENPLKSYDIKKVIDEGSSAKVFTAHPMSNPSEECAIKVVPLSYSLEFIFNEIYVLKNLKHKNIVDFKESFLRWDGKTREVWIAMEKCARGDVTSRAGKVNQRETARIARDVSKSNYLFLNDIMKLNDI